MPPLLLINLISCRYIFLFILYVNFNFYFIIGSVATEQYERERGSLCNQLCGAFVNTSHVFCAALQKEIYGASSLVLVCFCLPSGAFSR